MHGDLDASTVLALVNAILFKGTWEHPFDVAKTANAPFTRGDGSMVQAPTMTKEDALATTSIPNGSLVILPFAGKDLEMVILLPDAADGLPALEAALTGDQLSSWIAAAVPLRRAARIHASKVQARARRSISRPRCPRSASPRSGSPTPPTCRESTARATST